MNLDRNSRKLLVRALVEERLLAEAEMKSSNGNGANRAQDEHLINAVKPHRQRPFATWLHMANLPRRAPMPSRPALPEDDQRYMTAPMRDLSDPNIARVVIQERPTGQQTLTELLRVQFEAVEAANFCKARGCDTLLVGCPDRSIPSLFTPSMGELLDRGLTLAFYHANPAETNGVPADKTLSIHASYEAARDAVRKVPLPKAVFGYLNCYRRPGAFGDTVFIEISPQASRSPASDEAAAMWKEFGELARSRPGMKAILLIEGDSIRERFLNRAMYQIENLGGRCCFRLVDMTGVAFSWQISSRVFKSLQQADVFIKMQPRADQPEMPSGGWGFFNRPSYDAGRRAYVIDGAQEPNFMDYTADLAPLIDSDMRALSSIGKGRLVLNFGSAPIRADMAVKLAGGVSAALAAKGGLVIVQSSDNAFISANLAAGAPLVQAYSDTDAGDLLDHHIAIAPPMKGWRFIDRPQRIRPESSLVGSKVRERANLSSPFESAMWKFLGNELDEIAMTTNVNALFLDLEGEKISQAAVNFLNARYDEFPYMGASLYFIAVGAALREQLRAHDPPLRALHKRRAEAMLERNMRHKPPEKGWEVFAFDPVEGRNNVVKMTFADPPVGVQLVWGATAPQSGPYDEIRALQNTPNDVIMVFPPGLEGRHLRNLNFMSWAITELSLSRKVVAGVHSDRRLLRTMGFQSEMTFYTVDAAIERYKTRWK